MKVTNLTSGEVVIRKGSKKIAILPPLAKNVDTRKWKVDILQTNVPDLERKGFVRTSP